MAILTIRNLDESIKARLRLSAAQHGCSMEEEVRRILRRALTPQAEKGLGSWIHERFAALGGAALDLPKRSLPRRAPDLDQGDR